ncbi:MAG: hypothetical protein CSB47_09955 [Proteobacteria bacterium]|nr:MAG: hypothetical protein CSB47_09955 [Pseudomonadota bacterium]
MMPKSRAYYRKQSKQHITQFRRAQESTQAPLIEVLNNFPTDHDGQRFVSEMLDAVIAQRRAR